MAGYFEVDPYLYPGTDVLKNKLGIRDDAQLEQFEYEATALRAAQLKEKPIEGKFDLAHYSAIHKHLFQDVYEWAGEVRTINFSKGTSRFTEVPIIEHNFKVVSDAFAREGHLKGLQKPEFVDRLAHYYAAWNRLHPAREGNGRVTREFLSAVAKNAGFEFDQTRIDNAKQQWNDAARESFKGNLDPIKSFFNDAIRPARSVAFEHLPTDEALNKFPELKGLYGLLDELRTKYTQAKVADPDQRARSKIVEQLDQGKAYTRQDPQKAPQPERDADARYRTKPSDPER